MTYDGVIDAGALVPPNNVDARLGRCEVPGRAEYDLPNSLA